ncbi:uncharacterized protein LOC112043209 [Bicyclus anynana]|uniref:Uncharacterized protein LOC112043209 n=1 Tax=Bicyclus anynana TaxID=110368 RepID=A0A6J1MGJ1_BICAN|nr:uncharacterized protein LOC112043209 [Bicyclus anynana]
MLRPCIIVALLAQIRSAYVTEPPTFADRLDRLYQKVEKFTISPPKNHLAHNSKLYAKLDRLNSLTPDRNRDLTDDDDELLSAMQLWGSMSDDQLRGLVNEIQQVKEEDRSERLPDGDYDGDWPDDEQDRDNEDYNNDGEEWDPLEDETGSTSRPIVGVTPSAFTRLDAIDYIDPIAATNERPRILDDSHATPKERMSLRKTALTNVREVFRSNDCLVPQPRWLYLRNLAPAADTVYVPPCVKLHRCAPDACCCKDERQECAPIDGKFVAIPVYLGKANRNLTVARMLFFNHTRCSCVNRDSITESTARTKIDFREDRRDEILARRDNGIRDRQNDWRAPTEEPKLERDEEQTSPPQLRRCTCPALFRNRIKDGICSCVCDWPDTTKKRDCLSLARGKEHFGLRDRVCLAQGDCVMPSCEYGPYERSAGRCPYRRVKRRYHSRRYQEKV